MRIFHALWITLLISVLPNLAAAQTASYSLHSTAVSQFGTGPCAMLLAGLGLIGVVGRRRTAKPMFNQHKG